MTSRSRLSPDITVTDLFCGAGGSSDGARRAGATVRIAANHWPLAIATHTENFPDVDHDCADISQVDPRRYPATTVLLASPECTHHSQARSKRHDPNLFNQNGDPAAERSRATMWDVPRFAEQHLYQSVVVENVVEIRRWAPFHSWLSAMDALGYNHETVYLNSMVAWPTPQSRDRIYIVFWRKGNRAPDLKIPARAWCPKCCELVDGYQAWKQPAKPWGKYRQQYLYRCPDCHQPAWPLAYPAASAIDWTLPAQRIGDRARPLADATMRRIRVGLERFGPQRFVVDRGQVGSPVHKDGNRVRTVDRVLWTQTATETQGVACPPMVVPVHHGADGPGARSAAQTWPTQTGRSEHALVVAMRAETAVRDADTEPITTQTGVSQQALLGVPFVVELRGGSSDARSAQEPLAAVCAAGNHHALVMRNNTGGAEMLQPADDNPFGTMTTAGHQSLVGMPFTIDYHGNGSSSPVVQPLPTQDTRDRHALIDPGVEVDDCTFRMFEPHEIQAAMAFEASYVVKGNKRQKVKQLGNAVTPPVSALILERVIASLERADG